MAVDPRLLGSLRWRLVGPHRGGRVVAVAGHPADPMTFYFGACAGGVWKTTDGGLYWDNVSDGFFQTAAIGALAVADARRIFAALVAAAALSLEGFRGNVAPLLPAATVLRPVPGQAAVAGALLALLDVSVGDAAWDALDPPQRRQQTLEAVKLLLLRESHVQPLLVIFEDLHWIDSETQALLDGLIESLATTRVLLLVNYRPEYQHAWGGKTYYLQLRIYPLPPASAWR